MEGAVCLLTETTAFFSHNCAVTSQLNLDRVQFFTLTQASL